MRSGISAMGLFRHVAPSISNSLASRYRAFPPDPAPRQPPCHFATRRPALRIRAAISSRFFELTHINSDGGLTMYPDHSTPRRHVRDAKVSAKLVRLFAAPERWPSGLRRTLGKRV